MVIAVVVPADPSPGTFGIFGKLSEGDMAGICEGNILDMEMLMWPLVMFKGKMELPLLSVPPVSSSFLAF